MPGRGFQLVGIEGTGDDGEGLRGRRLLDEGVDVEQRPAQLLVELVDPDELAWVHHGWYRHEHGRRRTVRHPDTDERRDPVAHGLRVQIGGTLQTRQLGRSVEVRSLDQRGIGSHRRRQLGERTFDRVVVAAVGVTTAGTGKRAAEQGCDGRQPGA